MNPLVHITEATNIAFHAMGMLAGAGPQRFSVRRLAGILNVSETHLAKVMQRLAKAGLVDSTRGPKGGFLLRRPAKDITLLDILEAIDGPLAHPRCLLNRPICLNGQCMLRGMVTEVDRIARQHLAGTDLSQLKFLSNGQEDAPSC